MLAIVIGFLQQESIHPRPLASSKQQQQQGRQVRQKRDRNGRKEAER